MYCTMHRSCVLYTHLTILERVLAKRSEDSRALDHQHQLLSDINYEGPHDLVSIS